MLDTLLLSSIARQLMSADEVEVQGKRLPRPPYQQTGLQNRNLFHGRTPVRGD